MNVSRTIVVLLFLILQYPGPPATAGPVPYTSVRIYCYFGNLGVTPASSPENIRKDADAVISLKGGPAIDFFYSLHWNEHADTDPAVPTKAGPVIAVIDFYYRDEGPYFEGNHDTLYLSREYLYDDKGDFLPSPPLISRILALTGDNLK